MKHIIFIIIILTNLLTVNFAQQITYCIQNEQVTGSSPMYYEFDVYAEADAAGYDLSDGIFYLNYNSNYFGASVVSNGHLSVDRRDDMALLDIRVANVIYIYTPILTADNTTNRFGVVWELADATKTFAQAIPTTSTQLCHVRIEIADISQTPDLQFHLPLMQRETFYYDTVSDANFGMNVDTCLTTNLPIALSYFKAEKDERTAVLKWRTATETNSSHFNIQRSTDGQKWESIGKVTATGNSQTKRDYHFTDSAPFSGDNYYRLQQVDLDGTSEYSPIEVLKFEDRITDGILVYPNPVNASFYVEYPYDEYDILSIELFDIHGKKVFSQQTNSTQNRWQIDTEGLSPGAYFLHLITPIETIARKVIKQ